jgi:hypothetical protein
VACRSQNNPRCIVSHGVPPGAANLGFGRASCPRRLDRPVLGGSASGFLMTTRSSAFVCLAEKSVNTLLATPLGSDLVFTTDLSIFAWDHIAISTRTT